jgi:hypothetical protein
MSLRGKRNEQMILQLHRSGGWWILDLRLTLWERIIWKLSSSACYRPVVLFSSWREPPIRLFGETFAPFAPSPMPLLCMQEHNPPIQNDAHLMLIIHAKHMSYSFITSLLQTRSACNSNQLVHTKFLLNARRTYIVCCSNRQTGNAKSFSMTLKRLLCIVWRWFNSGFSKKPYTKSILILRW